MLIASYGLCTKSCKIWIICFEYKIKLHPILSGRHIYIRLSLYNDTEKKKRKRKNISYLSTNHNLVLKTNKIVIQISVEKISRDHLMQFSLLIKWLVKGRIRFRTEYELTTLKWIEDMNIFEQKVKSVGYSFGKLKIWH